jgi:hypothetical protein
MHQSNRVGISWLFLAVAAMSFSGKASALKEVKDDKYKPGQVWSYKTRAEEQASTLTILRVDELADKKRIVHIRVEHIHLKNCRGGPAPEAFEHMPFAKDALDTSTVKLLNTGPVPDFKNGYSEWRSAWDANNAGYYTITVAQALDVSQKTFDQGIGCSK